MPRPEFSQAGTQGGGQTIAVQNRPHIKTITVEQTAEVAAGDFQDSVFYAPSGKLYKLITMYLAAPEVSAATSGSHQFSLFTDVVAGTRGESTHNSGLTYDNSAWVSADLEQIPSTEDGVTGAVNAMRATEDKGLKVQYRNDTDAAQTATRTIKLVVQEDGY